jgi:leucyl/phenylalanyl-tRNA---protein transferase
MPLFLLDGNRDFPPVDRASPEGIVAVGGDLSSARLIRAYSRGIFPWYSEGEPILWWSPDPRFVLVPAEIHVSRSMRRILKKEKFRITFNRNFRAVIDGCRQPRIGEPGTWITPEMLAAYCRLHEIGFAHSVEAWRGAELAGGLYGVSLGNLFFAESMFHRQSDASKAALIVLGRFLERRGAALIDCQVYSPHVASLGGRMIPRHRYIEILKREIHGNGLFDMADPDGTKSPLFS